MYLVFGALLGAAALAAIFLPRGSVQTEVAAPETAAVKQASAMVQPQKAVPGQKPGTPSTQATAGQRNYPEEFKQAQNYLAFARSAVAAARAGNPDAQYYLGKVLGYCEAAYKAFFYRKGKAISLDEGLQYSIEVGRSEHLTKSIYDKCHDLEAVPDRDSQFGIASDWIKMASDAGQPGAQSAEALAVLQGISLGSRVPVDPSSPEKTDPHSLLIAAVQSKDPEALWNAGDAQGLVNQSFDDKSKNQYAWWLVSCQQGLDCSPDSDRILMVCQNKGCPVGLSGADFIRVIAGDSWQEVERRAQDITDKLNAEDWNSLQSSF
jgi:TPR repeat protein